MRFGGPLPSFDRRRPKGAILIAALVAGCTSAPIGTGSTPSTLDVESPSTVIAGSTSPSKSTDFIAEADGYTLTVTADRLTLAPGETVTFSATFHNGTDKPIDVAGSHCGGGTTGYVFVPLPVEPEGKAWTGIRRTFKDFVLKNGMGPGAVPALEPLQLNMSGPECGEWAISSQLAPGDSVSSSMSWKAEIVAGVDALAGVIPFSVSAGYDQQNGPPSYPPDFTGVRGSWTPMFKALEVKGAIEVVGEGKALKGPGEVIDTVLADKTFGRWLARQSAKSWSNANLYLNSQAVAQGILPKGPAWQLELFREPRNWAIASVDPFDASLISVTYCNIPCDR